MEYSTNFKVEPQTEPEVLNFTTPHVSAEQESTQTLAADPLVSVPGVQALENKPDLGTKYGTAAAEIVKRAGGTIPVMAVHCSIPDNLHVKFLEGLNGRMPDCDLTELLNFLKLCEYYNTYRFRSYCNDLIGFSLNANNVLDVFEAVVDTNNTVLEQYCTSVISINAHDIITSPRFTSLPKHIVHLILRRDDLMIAETQIFEALMNWGKAQVTDENANEGNDLALNLRDKEFIALCVRPNFLNRQTLTQLVKMGIITQSDISQITQDINYPTIFHSENRKRVQTYIQAKRMFYGDTSTPNAAKLSRPWPGMGKVHTIRFSVNMLALLHGCAFFGPMDGACATYNVFLRVVDNTAGKVCAVSNQEVMFKSGTAVFSVKLENPPKVLPGRWYSMEYKLTGAATACGYGFKQFSSVESVGSWQQCFIIEYSYSDEEDYLQQVPYLSFHV